MGLLCTRNNYDDCTTNNEQTTKERIKQGYCL